jgi:hypothetical protein
MSVPQSPPLFGAFSIKCRAGDPYTCEEDAGLTVLAALVWIVGSFTVLGALSLIGLFIRSRRGHRGTLEPITRPGSWLCLLGTALFVMANLIERDSPIPERISQIAGLILIVLGLYRRVQFEREMRNSLRGSYRALQAGHGPREGST